MQKRVRSFDGLDINYFINRRSDFFLIFLHGAGGDLNCWKNYINFFSKKGYSTLAIDLRGHGSSGRPLKKEGYSIENCAKDVYEVIRTEKIKKFVIVGHCFGGMVCLKFDEFYPALSNGIVLINSSYKVPFLKSIFKTRSIFYLLGDLLKNNQLFSKKLGKRHYDGSYSKGDFINLKRIYNDIIYTGIGPLLFVYSSMFKFNERRYLKNIDKPVLIIYGMRDVFFNFRLVKKMNRLIKNSRLYLISDANHWPIFDHSKKIEESIIDFLKEII